MNIILRVFALVLAVSGSVPVLAQPVSQGITRAQVRDEMLRYEAAGFNPARMNPRTWVDDAQAASAKVALVQSGAPTVRVAERDASGKCGR
ncbi:DUF4148 domain-containing protein [Burkholderia sp. BCC1972]|uniref:DUF4148 domain-containing protein n=1 Tax=Burkholderia sp. BCC1972 TaxID=2817438 RepID=UPI002ABD3662|nr:DUF4148 domain-containing protein [Burkholderia sp. BCC1972]